ncbi:MAG: alpha/beta fold hydrolase [Actinomycetia bacterium]|nr:alpha/beta fold hydrolase [Actinomycetes bacterium]
MREQHVAFYSGGERVVGTLYLPDPSRNETGPAIVQGPGWMGLRTARLYGPYHEAFVAAGMAVLIIDYRGFGDSGGDPLAFSPTRQLEDLINAVTYLTTRPEVNADRIGVFGSGGTGGGNAVSLAAADPRVKCVVSQVPVADGRDWLRRMRRVHEWYEFLARLEADRAKRVATGQGELVRPQEIMIPTPERRTTSIKRDVDSRVPTRLPLAAAEGIMAYQPIEVVDRITPRPMLIVAVENDPVTPTEHAEALYERAGPPKRLIIQRQTTHYAAYRQYGKTIIPQMVDWFRRGLTAAPIRAVETFAGREEHMVIEEVE